VLRPALLASAALMIVVGIGIWLIVGEPLIGIIIAAVGVFDLLTINFVVGRIGRASVGSAPPEPAGTEAEPPAAEPVPTEADPSYNPYARED
jgi:hypothetical protein